MCGFIASFGQNIENKGLKTAFNQLKRRGPDSKGIWTEENVFLGSRRLAIFDLHERSDQPMKSICERYLLVFNGSIYNYLELNQNLKKYENDVFEIGAMLYAFDKHLVTIKSFENSEKALLYKKKLKKGVEIENVLSQRKHKIFVVNIENFQKLYTTNDADEYLKFYKKYYNLKN